jgi:hypothetical protein
MGRPASPSVQVIAPPQPAFDQTLKSGPGTAPRIVTGVSPGLVAVIAALFCLIGFAAGFLTAWFTR